MNIQDIRKQYPQYEDLTDAELTRALHAKFYSDMPLEEFSAQIGGKAKSERSLGDSVKRQLQLTARSLIEAPASIPNMIADPVVSAINAVSGANLPMPSQALERTLTRVGLPEPDSPTEKFARDVNKGMVSAAAGKFFIPYNTMPIKDQIIAGGMGAGSANIAEQAGAGPVGQLAAGLVGGVALPAAMTGASEAARTIKSAIPALAEPLTPAGRENIVARALQNAATDKSAAQRSASQARQFVPGSEPTLAQAADDIGIASQAKAIENAFPAAFKQRYAEQDAARQAGLSKVFGTAQTVQTAEEARDAATKALRDAAFADAKAVNVKPVVNTADSILNSGAGKRQEVERAMSWVKGRIDGEKDAERIYAIRQDINDIIAGKLAGDPEKASLKLAAKELKYIRGVLDAQLEKSAPGFKKYLETYANWSKEIDKAKLGQEIQQKATASLAQRGPSGIEEGLSPAAFTREFEKRAQEIADAGPVASDALSRVAMDLRRAEAPTRSTRAKGSDTLQNIVANNMLARAGVGGNGPIGTAASKAVNLMYRPFGVEDMVQQGLLNAHLDPEEGARLLARQLSVMPQGRMEQLLQRLRGVPIGGLLGITASN